MAGRPGPPTQESRRGSAVTGVPATILCAGRRVPVEPRGLTIGRGERNDLVIANEQVSREHARVYPVDDGYRVADLDTRNGTYLNGERFVGESRPLADGDAIAIGGETLRVLTGKETDLASRELPILGTQTVEFTGGRLTIGRARSNDVVLDDPNVSRFHAEVTETDDGIQLTALASRNGTRVNGQLVQRAVIDTGSEIGIGPFRLIFDGESFLARDDRGALRLDALDVVVRVKGKQILARTTLTIEPGQFVALIGESGSVRPP
jgi:pSer/pThr/pTyr-binding forkhead associated (FHA) protein